MAEQISGLLAFEGAFALLGLRSESVSYTHLDVYKRQPINWDIIRPPPFPKPSKNMKSVIRRIIGKLVA